MSSAEDFERERPHLVSVAYRMLGSRAEAEDVVQEAWLRFDKARRLGEIHDLRGWLTTVVGRLALDVLKSARVRREAYPGQWLPEPVVSRLDDTALDPADTVTQRTEVGMALLVVLEKLTPEQRVALVLHDAFALPYEEIAGVLGTSVEAARQHASRGRRAVAAGGLRHNADRPEQRRVLEAFLAAARSGDTIALAKVLAPDVVAIGDGGGVVNAGSRAVLGADKVARFWIGILASRVSDLSVEFVSVNGDVGVVVRATLKDGAPLRSVFAVSIEDGLITGIFHQLNPAKLRLVDDV